MSGKQSIIVIFVLFGFLLSGKGQNEYRNNSFGPGEVVRYKAFYNWKFVWLNAGEVTFTADTSRFGDQPTLFLEAYGNTYKGYDTFFRVRDTFRVHVDTLSLRPYWFNRITNEGKYTANFKYRFDRQKDSIFCDVVKRNKRFYKDTLEWEAGTHDLLSSIYSARNLDYDSYRPGEKIPLKMLVDRKVYNLNIKYLGKEIVKLRNGRQFRCLKFSPQLVEGTIFKEDEGMVVWVTDDLNRVPVLIEAKILVGSVKAVLEDVANLRHPLSSEIFEKRRKRR